MIAEGENPEHVSLALWATLVGSTTTPPYWPTPGARAATDSLMGVYVIRFSVIWFDTRKDGRDMAEGYTRRDAERAVERLGERIGFEPGWLFVERMYGQGYAIRADGGRSNPFGDQIRSAREIWDAVYFAERVLDAAVGNAN